MAASNEVHHLKGPGTEGGKSRKAEDRRGEAGLEGADGAVDRHQPVQPCKADSCLEREDRMEKLLDKRQALVSLHYPPFFFLTEKVAAVPAARP
ncbi:unnamed protein product [Ectocarpus sp. CCAP 1310/34]|nr:unnamed protein product [Ectocarpus sp. CCAP 1310/34]